LLISILVVPLVVALLCLFARPRGLVESLNIAGFVSVLLLGVKLFESVLMNDGNVVTAWDEFLRADALSAWMVLLISIVSLATSLYAVRYFLRDLADATLPARRFHASHVLTLLLPTGIALVWPDNH